MNSEQGSLGVGGSGLPAGSPGGDQSKKRLRLALAALAVVIIIIGVALLASHQPGSTPGKGASKHSTAPGTSSSPKPTALTIVGTQPTVSQISMTTQSMTVQFNQALAQNSAQVTSSPALVSGSSVAGDTLTINFALKTLQSTKKYTITIKTISAANGQKLTNKQYTFTPQPGQPSTSGQSGLLNIGLSNDQTNAVFDDMSKFDPWAQQISIDLSTIKHYRLNSSDAWSPWAVSFTVAIDSTNYTVICDYYDTQNVEVKIYDPSSNKLLYSAGNPGSI